LGIACIEACVSDKRINIDWNRPKSIDENIALLVRRYGLKRLRRFIDLGQQIGLRCFGFERIAADERGTKNR
jgi:hypothetical protein